MLPRRVGGAEPSGICRFLFSLLLALFQDQLPKLSTGVPPLVYGGGGGVAGRDCDWEDGRRVYWEKESRIR